tara:strand:+ start:594 stop:1475 length:882 start_codon:yes stop_codon:yes gene_type:complete
MANRETILDTFLAPWQQTIRDFTGVTGERSGLNNGPIVEAVPQYNVTPSEKVQQGENNAYIIIGRDRPRGPEGGIGGEIANTGAGCIDIIAGMAGVTAKNTDADGEPVVTNKNPDLDSARIYISQRARDIDSEEYFSLAEGQVGFVEQSSAIAIKADSVRLIGRQGIKLVTGDSYSGGSGFWIGDNTQGIDLIAGNDDEDLQPLVKGNDLAKVLDRIINLLTELEGAINATTAFAIAAAIPIYPPVPAALALLKFEQQSMKSFNIRATTLKLDYSATNPIAFSNFRSKYNTTN